MRARCQTCPCCFHPADPGDVIVLIHFGGKITQSNCNIRRCLILQRLSLNECVSRVSHFFQSSRQPGELLRPACLLVFPRVFKRSLI